MGTLALRPGWTGIGVLRKYDYYVLRLGFLDHRGSLAHMLQAMANVTL